MVKYDMYEKPRIEKLLKPNKIGFCRICKKNTSLSADHVPPKCVGNNSTVTIRSGNRRLIKQSGAKFHTICQKCNNMLGFEYDIEFKKLYDELLYLKTNKLNYKFAGVTINPNKLLRSLCGHLLAIWFGDDIDNELSSMPHEIEMLDEMRRYVLKEIDEMQNIEIFYWYYPNDEIIINQYWSYSPYFMIDNSAQVFGTTFKTFPVAFWIINKKSTTIFPKLMKLKQLDDDILMKVNISDIKNKNFPEYPTDTGMSLMSLESIININKK